MKIDGVFLMESVRLKSYKSTAMWHFTREKDMKKWLGENTAVNEAFSEFDMYDRKVSMKIIHKDYDSLLKMILLDGDKSYEVEVYLMNCTSLTEFCTQINLIQKGFDSNEERDLYKKFWHEKLNNLRFIFNGSWIIEDKDLILSCLR